MCQANVGLVRRCYELWASRDVSAIPKVMDPEVVIDLSRNIFNPAVYRGHDGVRKYVEAVEEVWEEFEARPEEFIDGGDTVVTAIRISGRGGGSGVPVEMRLFNIWTFRERKVLRMTGGYRDRAEALEAAGLRE
jgi:uncharacterized protein